MSLSKKTLSINFRPEDVCGWLSPPSRVTHTADKPYKQNETGFWPRLSFATPAIWVKFSSEVPFSTPRAEKVSFFVFRCLGVQNWVMAPPKDQTSNFQVKALLTLSWILSPGASAKRLTSERCPVSFEISSPVVFCLKTLMGSCSFNYKPVRLSASRPRTRSCGQRMIVIVTDGTNGEDSWLRLLQWIIDWNLLGWS